MNAPMTASIYQFHARIQGNPNHPWLFFLHGFLGDSRDFETIISQLCDRFYCIAIDLPGHGKTIVQADRDPVVAYGMESTGEGLIAFLQSVAQSSHGNLGNSQKMGLVGYSMGGRLGLFLLFQYPHFFYGGVLESASPGLKTAAERSLRQAQDFYQARQLETQDFETFLEHWYKQPLFRSIKQQKNFAQLLHRRQQGNPHQLAQSLRYLGLGTQSSLWLQLSDNRIPLLFLVGEADNKFRGINQEMVDRCPFGQLQIIAGASHNCHFSHPVLFANTVRSFFETQVKL